jgi:tRNA 2-thiouridine synthesizing protein A
LLDPQAGRDLTRELLLSLERWEPGPCAGCGASLCAHAYVLNVALGHKRRPLCVDCLARGLGRKREDFLAQIHDYVSHRECYRAGWAWASAREGSVDLERPTCIYRGTEPGSVPPATGADAVAAHADAEWDAGDMACGDLVLELRLRLERLAPGDVLRVRATDPAAGRDIPSWCRLTRHRLRAAGEPLFWIEKRRA